MLTEEMKQVFVVSGYTAEKVRLDAKIKSLSNLIPHYLRVVVPLKKTLMSQFFCFWLR